MAISPTPLTTISFAENNDPSHRLSSTTTTLVTEYTNSKPCPCSDLFETDLSPQHSRHPQSQTTYGKMPSVTMANSAHSGSCDGSSTTTSTTTSSSTNTTATTESTILSTWEPSPVVDTLPCQQTSPSATTVTARYEFTPAVVKAGPPYDSNNSQLKPTSPGPFGPGTSLVLDPSSTSTSLTTPPPLLSPPPPPALPLLALPYLEVGVHPLQPPVVPSLSSPTACASCVSGVAQIPIALTASTSACHLLVCPSRQDDCASQLKKSAQALSHQQEQALGQLSSFDSYFSTSLPSSSSSFTPSSTYHAPFSKSVTSSTLPSSVVTPPSPIITVSSLPPPSSPSFQLSPSVLDQAHPKTLLRHASLPFLLDTTRLHPFDVAPSPTSPTSPSSPISAFSRLKKSPSWFPPFQRKNPGTLSTVSYTSSISINSTYTFDGPGASPEPEKQLRKARSFSFTQHSSTNNKNNNNNTNNNNSNTSENVFKRVMKLTRNQSIPLSLKESFTDTTLRKSNSNVFSFPVLKMNRTASDKSNSGELLHDYSVTQIPATSVPLFKSRPRTSSTATVPLAPIIACIKRGNFMRLTDIDMDALLKDMKEKNSTIFENYVLTSLVISESDAKILARLIKSSEGNMRTFKLDRCAVSQSAYKILLDACTHNKTITSLTINRSVVNDKIMRYLSKMLAKNNMIKELDISNNRITAQGIEHLADALALNKTLTRLCLQSNNIKRAGAPFLASILIKNRVIRHLNAGSNGLGAEGVAEIAESIKYNRALNSLSLDLNEMGPQGAAALAKALFTNRHLTHLYVPHNNIGDQGVHDLCRSLEHNQFLISLDLEFNHIGNNQNLVGMQALAKVLKTNTRLREINLAFNTLAPEAIQALMEGLSVNSTLESIMFTNCGISTEGAMAIAKVLPSTKGLQNLGLTANPDIGVEGYWALATGLEKNQFLKGIQLDYNSADRHALYESIQNSLTRNYVWQRTVYMAACRIMVLSRIVLLGQPVQQRSLQSYMQQHQQLYWLQQQEQQVDETEDSDNSENAQQKSSSGLGWSLRRKVNKMERQLSGGSSPTSSFFKGKNTTNVSRILSNGSDTGFFEHEQEPENTSHSNLHSRQGSLAISGSSNNNSAMSSPLLTQYPAMGSSHHHEMNSLNEPPKHHQLSQAPTHGYNAHKVLANMSNMPYEIFETICAFLDTERTMNLAQIRSAIQVGGTRSSLFPGAPVHHTREKMMEQVFHTRYISSVGVRYSVKAGDERI